MLLEQGHSHPPLFAPHPPALQLNSHMKEQLSKATVREEELRDQVRPGRGGGSGTM